MVAGNRTYLGKIGARSGIYPKGNEMAHRLTGKAEKQTQKQAESRSQLTTATLTS